MSSRFIQCGNLHTNLGWSMDRSVPTPPMIRKKHKVPCRAERYESRIFRDVHHKERKIDAIAQLEIAVKIRNARVFDRVLDTIDWGKRTPSEFVRVVDLALRMGAYSAASRVSALALAYHPNEETVQRHNAILAPPQVTSRRASADPSIRANRDWLKAHGDDYRGKWVGIKDGELVGAADSLDGLIGLISDRTGTLITRVF